MQVPVLAGLLVLFVAVADVEGQTNAQERAGALRVQLTEVLAQEENLQTQLKYLEEISKPENIEKSLAGIGSTHPEDLREARRRQLELEKMNLQAQLKLLADSQMRLESSIVRADADAYNQSATVIQDVDRQSSAKQLVRKKTRSRSRLRRNRKKSKAVRLDY